MVLAVHQVKFAPLSGCEWAKDRVVGQCFSSSEGRVARSNQGVHACDILKYFGMDEFDWSAAWLGVIGGLSAGWKVSEPNNDVALPAFAGAVAR